MSDTDVAAGRTGTGPRIGALTRGFAGAVTLVGALTWILLNLQAPGRQADLVVGAVLAVGGLVLLMPHRVPLPALPTAGASVAAAVGGALAGLLTETTRTGGMWAYVARRGWPYEWLNRGAVADDPQTARALAEQASWQVDAVNLTATAVFWGFLGLLLAAAVTRTRRVSAL
ncbi:hypothetical protein [Couchioplanes caeruleus]|uniref:hypothetical protein n=1 Tax=Couchioplanes caeruleus TaxID=56438 RepID=UPI0011600C51|nr:hypothetical protein [Couchioplanes caeruleus]